MAKDPNKAIASVKNILSVNEDIDLSSSGGECLNPTLAKCGGEAQHFQSWGFGVLRDSRMFKVRQQGPKHLALRCSWCHWKGLEAQISKMASH
jgi:hypothetical protein